VERLARRCIICGMALASPAIHPPRRALLPTATSPGISNAIALRDDLTRRRLLAAVGHLPGLTVERFDRTWWDGQARVASLVVRGGRRMRRMRVIETEGECMVVPYSRRLAHRWLAARRRPRRAELDIVQRQGRAGDLVVDGWTDAVRCSAAGCGALRPLAYPGCCPLCGA
jgi:hypothetical protein